MNLEHLRQEVEQVESAVDSAVTFISGIANRLREALMAEDGQEQIETLADELDAAKVKLATAIAANSEADGDSTDVDGDPIEPAQSADDSSGGFDAGNNGETNSATGAGDTTTTGESTDEADPSEENEAAADGEEVSGDTENLPTGADVVTANSDDTDSVDEDDQA